MTLTQIFAKVLNMSLTASLVIVLVIAARFVLRKSPKVFSYALWAVVLFRLLCPVSLPSPVSLLSLLDAPVAQTEGITTTVEYIPYKVVETAAENPQPDHLPQNPVAQTPAQSQQTTVETKRNPLSTAEIVTYIWLAGIAVMVIVGVGSYLRFRRHLTVAVQVKDNIYLVDHIDSAFVAGLVCPKVYLPSDIPLKQMGYIIAHEQYHIRRLDHVTKHLSFAALCIHWFNPLVWVAFILSGKDLEMSCDEAVIKKLGEGIRADYSASLLSLATGRRIIAGTPLAFGEGDTKSRIKNMAKWKQSPKWVSIVSFILSFTILTACAANPEKEVVTSKNDGSFDVNVVQTATQPADQVEITTQNVSFTDSFTSTDGSVYFSLNINEDIVSGAMPVVTVSPHLLSGDDVQRIATALFGDAVFYEQGPYLDEQFSKSELQRKLNLHMPYTNGENLIARFGAERYTPDYLNTTTDVVKKFVEEWTAAYENAPEENPYGPCQWTFKNSAYYFYSEEEIAERGTSELSEGEEEICARVLIDGIPYGLSATRRDGGAYKINRINVRITSGASPMDIEHGLFMAELCSVKPTDEQVMSAQQKASQILSQMGMGEWYIDECYVEIQSKEILMLAKDQYIIHVNAVPVINGVPAIRRPQLSNMKNDNVYTSKYALTDAQFQFSANGDLIAFDLDGAIDITETVNTNVATLSMDELMERVKNHITLSDSGAYSISMDTLESLEKDYGEEIVCNIDIMQLEYGLTRVKAPNTDDSYYYVPAILLSGTCNYGGVDTGMIYFSSDEMNDGPIVPLVCMNAVDGSIILIDNPAYD